MSNINKNRDIILATRSKLGELKSTVTPVRVKGHTDDTDVHGPHTLREHLNIEMDRLCKEKWRETSYEDGYQGHIEGKGRSFWIQGKKIDRNIRRQVQEHVGT